MNSDPMYVAPKTLCDQFEAEKRFVRHVAMTAKIEGLVLVACLFSTPEDQVLWMDDPGVIAWPDEDAEAIAASEGQVMTLGNTASRMAPGLSLPSTSLFDYIPDAAGALDTDSLRLARLKIRANCWGMF